MQTERVKCDQCGEIMRATKMLVARNPFAHDENINGCPKCYSIDSFVPVCDETDCTRDATCGFPTADGYRQTCGDHYRPVPHHA